MITEMDLDNLISKLRTYFSDKQYVSAVYLFGSIIKGTARKNSDIDLGVLFIKGIDKYECFNYKLEIQNELEELLKRKADIVDLQNASLYFTHQLMQKKRLIVEKDLFHRVEFEVSSRRQYLDMLPFYELYHNKSLERLERR